MYGARLLAEYIQRQVRELLNVWPRDLENALVQQLGSRGRQLTSASDFRSFKVDRCDGANDRAAFLDRQLQRIFAPSHVDHSQWRWVATQLDRYNFAASSNPVPDDLSTPRLKASTT